MARRAAGRWLALAAAAAVLAAGLARLGLWQLDRAEASRALRERFEAAASEAPLTAPPDALDEGLRFRRLELHGRYAAEVQFLLDNRIHAGRAGYEVLTPFRPDGGGDWVLVNRGWVLADPDRRRLPRVDVSEEPRSVVGRLNHLPQAGLALGGPDVPPAGSAEPVQVVSFPSVESLEARLGHGLEDYQLLLDAAEPDGFTRDWQAPGVPPERNLAYAGQWFLFALGAAAGAAVAGYRGIREARS